MKRFTPYLIGALATLVLLATFSLGQASARALAATGCFSDTNGHWAETAICWAASNGVVGGFPDGTFKPNNTVTRAQVAVMLKNQANVAPEIGQHLVNVGPSDWVVNGGDSAYTIPYTNNVNLRASASGTRDFQVNVQAPAMIYGRSTVLKGVTLCYDAQAASLTSVTLQLFATNATTGVSSLITSVSDSTTRTDKTCRTYNLSTPTLVLARDHIGVFLTANFPSTSDVFRVTSTTFIFEPYVPLAIGPEPLRPELPGLEAVGGAEAGQ